MKRLPLVNNPKTSLWIFLIFVNVCATQAWAKSYRFDTKKTKITFNIKFFGSLEKQGKFSNFKGHVDYQPNNINNSMLNLKVATASVKIDVPSSISNMLDGDLFKTKQYPYMTFQSKKLALKRLNQHSAKGKITGTLHFMGKKHHETFTVHFRELSKKNGIPSKILFNGFSTINRKVYGIQLPRLAKVAEQIPIRISGVLVSQ